MEVTFKLFKKTMFDVWKFKNILNNKDQYIILEKIKKYLNEIDDNDYSINHINANINVTKKDEDAFEKMTNIIEGIGKEEEIIYCDLKPEKKKLEEIVKTKRKSNKTKKDRIYNLNNKNKEK